MGVFFRFPKLLRAVEVPASILDCSDDEGCDVVVILPDDHAISDEEAVNDDNLDCMETNCSSF